MQVNNLFQDGTIYTNKKEEVLKNKTSSFSSFPSFNLLANAFYQPETVTMNIHNFHFGIFF